MSRWYDAHRQRRQLRDLERRLVAAERSRAQDHEETTDLIADLITDVVALSPGGTCAATVREVAA